MVKNVRLTLSQSTSAIKEVRITSYGGVLNAAINLASVIAPLGPIPIKVTETCQSACIGFLAMTPGPKQIDPSAVLMFHASATIASPQKNTPRCWCWTSIDNLFASLVHDGANVMLPWAKKLDEQLPILFSLCPHNPLDTNTGMYLTGQEYNELHDGLIMPNTLRSKCPSD
jgi:hypothetical protein